MFVVKHSANVKVGNVSVTYAPIKATCPASCPLRDSGCYAQGGNVAIHEKLLSAHTDGIGGDTIAELEGNEIADVGPTMPAGQPLRIHVAGDATTPVRAAHLARGASHWPGPVWSYTHAWRDVPRASWSTISVLASVETRAAALEALASGYAPAIVVDRHDSPKAVRGADGLKVIPCPAQTNDDVKCTDCKLCWNDTMLRSQNAAIGFAVHGPSQKRALKVLDSRAV